MNTDPHPTVGGFRLEWRDFRAPQEDPDDRSFGMWVLEDPDAPLDAITQEEFDHSDERMPYFGLIWPSAESLVAHILAGPSLKGLRVLDLGCGLGPCGFAALARGAHVTFFDWEPRALEIVAKTVRDRQIPAHQVSLATGDWRNPPPLGSFDRILGADVLYEERNAPAVADFLARQLSPAGEAWIADPGRRHAEQFPSLAAERGMALVAKDQLPSADHGRTITLMRLRRIT
jgi:predicted nicotinamide N-methyase